MTLLHTERLAALDPKLAHVVAGAATLLPFDISLVAELTGRGVDVFADADDQLDAEDHIANAMIAAAWAAGVALNWSEDDGSYFILGGRLRPGERLQ